MILPYFCLMIMKNLENILTIEEIEKLLEEKIKKELPTEEIKVKKFDLTIEESSK